MNNRSRRYYSMEDPTDFVRESCNFVASHARHVKVDEAACSKVAFELQKSLSRKDGNAASTWLGANGLHPKVGDINALAWVFLVDTLNFCFWAPLEKEPYKVRWQGIVYTGYWSLCAAVNRALDEGVKLLDAHFLSQIDDKTIEHVFRSDNTISIPLLQERGQVLREAGSVLLNNFGGSFENLLEEADWDAVQLVRLVLKNFSSFRDEALYDDRRIAFYKRAQILAADCWACCGKIKRIDRLTMFADYRVPQCLVKMGAIVYDGALFGRLERGEVLTSGCLEEVEIRACSIVAVEQIRKHLETLQEAPNNPSDDAAPVNSAVIDFELWTFAKSHSSQMSKIPIHRVCSIFY